MKFEGGLEIKKLDSVESIEAEIKMLQSKLEFYKELEKTKSPVEQAYKRIYGVYPMTDVGDGCWENFKAGYAAAQKDYKVGEWEPTPQTPEQVADGLKEAFREAVKQGVVSSVDKPETLRDVCMDWWDRVFGDTDDTETCIDNLVDEISLWLPKYQSASGSQNVYVECSVEGYNDCLNEIKGKLR